MWKQFSFLQRNPNNQLTSLLIMEVSPTRKGQKDSPQVPPLLSLSLRGSVPGAWHLRKSEGAGLGEALS